MDKNKSNFRDIVETIDDYKYGIMFTGSIIVGGVILWKLIDTRCKLALTNVTKMEMEILKERNASNVLDKIFSDMSEKTFYTENKNPIRTEHIIRQEPLVVDTDDDNKK